jgi:hypothetical protein
LNISEYQARFAEQRPQNLKDNLKEADTRAGRALTYALDIRKFEIELYWKRATYFWAFIAAAFAGYALTYKTGYTPTTSDQSWLSMLFSALGLVFSFAWYLVNRGSKFWQSNWERHVDLLEDMTLGPLYKVVAVTEDKAAYNPLTSPAQFSVSKLNQILSVFVTAVWLLLFVRSLLPVSCGLPSDPYKLLTVGLVTIFLLLLYKCGKSSNQFATSGLHEREREN